jgi:hypothetical protein
MSGTFLAFPENIFSPQFYAIKSWNSIFIQKSSMMRRKEKKRLKNISMTLTE